MNRHEAKELQKEWAENKTYTQVSFLGKANDQRIILDPLIKRTVEKFLKQDQPVLFSTYAGGQWIIITTRVNDVISQIALTQEDMHLLPADMRAELETIVAKIQPNATPFTMQI